MSYHVKCLLITLGFLYLFCQGGNSLNLNKISGSWLVRNSSDAKESESCAYVKINTTRTGVVLSYDAKRIPTVELTIFNSTNDMHNFTGPNNMRGNITFSLVDLPHYIVLTTTSEEIPKYLILTGLNEMKIDDQIKKKLNETADLKSITFYPTGQDTETCKQYIREQIDVAEESRPTLISERPVTKTTAKSNNKNSGSALIVSNLVVFISMLLIIFD